MTKTEYIQNKICDAATLVKKITVWRFLNKKIVFTNGCFDVLHAGHVYLLNAAASLAEESVLIVGLNSDDSVKRLKGNERPVNYFHDRETVIAGLFAVEAVIGFEEDTPLELIKFIRPGILVKGGDYTPETVVGADVVQQYGGKVEIIPYLENYSTSEIIRKIRTL